MLTTCYRIDATDTADWIYAALLRQTVARACGRRGPRFETACREIARRLDTNEAKAGRSAQRSRLPVSPAHAAAVVANAIVELHGDEEGMAAELRAEIARMPSPVGRASSVEWHSFVRADLPDPPDAWLGLAAEIETVRTVVGEAMADLPVALDARISLRRPRDELWPSGCCNIADGAHFRGASNARRAEIDLRLPRAPDPLRSFGITYVAAHELFIHGYQQFDDPALVREDAGGPYVFSEGFMDAATVTLLESTDRLNADHAKAGRSRNRARPSEDIPASMRDRPAEWENDLDDGYEAWRYLLDAGRHAFDDVVFRTYADWAIGVATKLNLLALTVLERCALVTAFRETWHFCTGRPTDHEDDVLPDEARIYVHFFQTVLRPDASLAEATARVRAQLATLPHYDKARVRLTDRRR